MNKRSTSTSTSTIANNKQHTLSLSFPVCRNVDTKHKNKKKSTSTGTDASVNVNDDAGDYEVAEEKIFRAIENVERKIVNTAEHLVLDEVDILFGKDHGHAIHDERTISIEDSNESESYRGRRGSRMIPSIPFTRKKATVDVKASSGEENKKKEQPKHSALVDLLDSYAESCNQRPEMF